MGINTGLPRAKNTSKRGRLTLPPNPQRVKVEPAKSVHVRKPYAQVFPDKVRYFLPNPCRRGFHQTSEVLYGILSPFYGTVPAEIHFRLTVGD